ncbi:MAG TPA: hypothetical protein PKE30_01525 [Niabella sp.]|nr:hypothetical protein [Niabella sp.]
MNYETGIFVRAPLNNYHENRIGFQCPFGKPEESTNVIYQRISYNWKAVPADPDDYKFFDTAVAGNADYLVTDDGHFNAASMLKFPKVEIINADDFLEILSKLSR